MNKKTQQIIVKILIVLLALAMLLTILVPALTVLTSAASVTEDDIKEIKGELSDITAARRETEQQLSAIRGDKSRAQDQIELIQGQIILIEHEISTSQRLIDQYDLDIQEKEEEIARLEEQEAEQYAAFCSHVRWLEETGSISYLSILFTASSFSQLLDYAMLIADIMDYSNAIITVLQQTQTELAEAKAALQVSREEQAEANETLRAQKADLEASEAEAQALYAEIAKDEAQLAAEAQQLAADEKQMAAELAAAEKKYAEQLAALKNNGDWYWPLPGKYYLSSLFGARKDPFTGKASNHTGIDIPANSGTEIHAAQDGIVTTVGTNRYHSYGFYCIISHANGKSTLYAHMKSIPKVSEGQTVTKGQVIGYVGSTGRSTGPHLHFELRLDGVRADALTLYPNLTFTTYSGATIKGGS